MAIGNQYWLDGGSGNPKMKGGGKKKVKGRRKATSQSKAAPHTPIGSTKTPAPADIQPLAGYWGDPTIRYAADLMEGVGFTGNESNFTDTLLSGSQAVRQNRQRQARFDQAARQYVQQGGTDPAPLTNLDEVRRQAVANRETMENIEGTRAGLRALDQIESGMPLQGGNYTPEQRQQLSRAGAQFRYQPITTPSYASTGRGSAVGFVGQGSNRAATRWDVLKAHNPVLSERIANLKKQGYTDRQIEADDTVRAEVERAERDRQEAARAARGQTPGQGSPKPPKPAEAVQRPETSDTTGASGEQGDSERLMESYLKELETLRGTDLSDAVEQRRREIFSKLDELRGVQPKDTRDPMGDSGPRQPVAPIAGPTADAPKGPQPLTIQGQPQQAPNKQPITDMAADARNVVVQNATERLSLRDPQTGQTITGYRLANGAVVDEFGRPIPVR